MNAQFNMHVVCITAGQPSDFKLKKSSDVSYSFQRM